MYVNFMRLPTNFFKKWQKKSYHKCDISSDIKLKTTFTSDSTKGNAVFYILHVYCCQKP